MKSVLYLLFSAIMAFVAVGFGFGVLFAFSALREVGMGRMDLDPIVLTSFIILGVISAGLAAIFGYGSKKIYQKRIDLSATLLFEKIILGKQKKYYLYLRPFDTTESLETNTKNHDYFSPQSLVLGGLDRDSTDFEYRMRKTLGKFAPTLALGVPGEAIGFGRVQSTEETWKETILKLIENATIVICVPGSNKGTMWEIKTLLSSHNYLHKSVFLLPPVDPRHGKYVWNEVQNYLNIEGINIPQWPTESEWSDVFEDTDYPGAVFTLTVSDDGYIFKERYGLFALSKSKILSIFSPLDPLMRKRIFVSNVIRWVLYSIAIVLIVRLCKF